MPDIKTKIIALIMTLPLPATMPGIETTATNFIKGIQPVVWVLAAAALIINGVMMAVGGEEGRAKAKKALPWTVLGCFLVVGAVQLAEWIVSNISF